MSKDVRIVCISDTHGKHEELGKLPDGDFLIHAGDHTNDIGQRALRQFLLWFDSQPHKYKILIAGNHDGAWQKWNHEARAMMLRLASSCYYLQNSFVKLEDIKFWGSPYTPEFGNWYFNTPRDSIHSIWSMMPFDADVVVTHGPPSGICDTSEVGGEHLGDVALLHRIKINKPRLLVCGHIHGGYGRAEINHDDGRRTLIANASVLDEKYKVVNKPIVVSL